MTIDSLFCDGLTTGGGRIGIGAIGGTNEGIMGRITVYELRIDSSVGIGGAKFCSSGSIIMRKRNG